MKIDVKGRLGVTAVVTVSRSRLPPRTPPQHTRRWTKRTCRLSIEGNASRSEAIASALGDRRVRLPGGRVRAHHGDWLRTRPRLLAGHAAADGHVCKIRGQVAPDRFATASHPRCVNSRANRIRPRTRALGSELLGSAIDLPLGCPRFRGRGTSAAPGARRRPWPARPSGRRPMPAAKRSPTPRFR
jgi:hypothetical protein